MSVVGAQSPLPLLVAVARALPARVLSICATLSCLVVTMLGRFAALRFLLLLLTATGLVDSGEIKVHQGAQQTHHFENCFN